MSHRLRKSIPVAEGLLSTCKTNLMDDSATLKLACCRCPIPEPYMIFTPGHKELMDLTTRA
jgi:hypothetical protein